MTITRPLFAIGLLAITCGALTGCTTGPVTVDALKPDTAGWLTQLAAPKPASTATPEQTAAGLSLPWKFVKFGTDRRTVEVVYAKGDGWCVLPVGFSVTRDGGNVLVTAVSRSTGHPDCPAVLKVGSAWLRLPLAITGKVKLEHAPVDSGWNSPNLLD